jgi:hypothetical protein
MAESSARTYSLVNQLLKWVTSLAFKKGFLLDEYELFLQVAATSPKLQRRVSDALESTRAPALAQLTRAKYYVLTKTQFEAALAALLDELGLTLDKAKRLFCDKLDWCNRRKRWKGFVGRLLEKVPPKWRNLVKVAGAAAPWIWDAIGILITLHPPVKVTLFAVRLSTFLAIGALDKLCKCDPAESQGRQTGH